MKSPTKYHGGKTYLASKIVPLMPPHLHYVEPYAGGLSVLLAKDPEGVSEVVNDLDGRLINFWHCLACPRSFEAFQRKMEGIPFCEKMWRQALERLNTPCEASAMICLGCAEAFFVCCRQSLAGRMDAFAPLSKTRVRRGMNEQASAWLNAVEGLPAVHARLNRVVILGPKPALEVIQQQDGPDTLCYLDPPYLHETRATTEEYAYEMTKADHFKLLDHLGSVRGKFLLSGYRSAMYDHAARTFGWNRHDFELPNNAAGGATKRRMTESLWCNF